MNLSDFAAIFPMRAPQIMWLTGAGISAASGIKTAWEMIWDFKRRLYCAQNNIPIRSLPSHLDDTIRARIQRHFNDQRDYPLDNHNDEYSFYFEKYCPTDADRRRYIARIVEDGKPSHGHKVLAALMAHDKIRVIWTTNFDRMLEDAAQEIKDSRRLTVASLGEPEVMQMALTENSWPVLGKIHGDFQSKKLKNTGPELENQDEAMRDALVDSCRRFGLAVAGYSGRDESVMKALEAGLHKGKGFPLGLFWFYREGSPVLPRVISLIEQAQRLGIDAHLIPIVTFDELMSAVALQIDDLPLDVIAALSPKTPRVTPAPLPSSGGHWPALRMNALPVVFYSTTCRLVRCNVGNTKEVHKRIELFSANVIAMRRQAGVLAFGADEELKRVFGSLEMKPLEVFSIEGARLRFDSAEKGLLYSAFSMALERERPLQVFRRREERLMCIDPRNDKDPVLEPLRHATRALHGQLPNSRLRWREAARWYLEWRFDGLWLLLEPTIHVERTDSSIQQDEAKEFVRERMARRYNKEWYEVFKGWLHVLAGEEEEKTLRTFGIGDGLDAVFTLRRNAAFSRRA